MPRGATAPLFREVVSKSESDVWEEAVREWDVASVREDEGRVESCVCGHEHLRYLFTIRNRLNGSEIYPIGSTCIKKFKKGSLSKDLDCRLQAIRLMREAERLGRGRYVGLHSGFFSRNLIIHMRNKGAFRRGDQPIGDAERDYGFLYGTFNKRKLDDEQQRRADEIIRDYIYPWLRDLYREVVRG